MIFNKIRLIISSWNRFWKFRSTVACSVIITFFSSSISPAFATEMLTDNYDSVSPKTTSQNKGQLKKPSSYKAAKHIANNIEKTNQPCSAPYKPYLEFGGAKYFNQTTNIAGIYDLFIPLFQQEDQLLFTDIRIFDRSGSSAEGNFHLGYRKLIDLTQMFGIYGAFDYKRSNSQNSFQQLTLGLEYWHHNWFAGANIYKPIGITKKYVGETSNQELINNRGIAKIITTNKLYEEALPGIDAELGYALTESLTSYVGGYYFAASGAETVTGPKIRVTYDYLQPVGRILGIVDGISIEAGAQHDKPRGYTAYVGLKFKVGLTNLAKNSNISGFKRHMVELVKRDPDIILNKAQETSQETHKQGKYSQDGEHGFIGGDPSPDQPYSARTDYENWPHEVLLQELGLPANATHNEVRKAYYQLSVVHHPDKARNNNTSQARFNGIYTELKNRHHAAKLRNQTAQATEGVILNLPTATVGENKYYGGGNTKNSNFAKNSRSHITASNYKYSNLDVEKLLASRLIEAKSKITAKNLTITTIAPISQATLSYSHNPQVFSNWLQQELTAQKKVILPVYLDKEEHWVTVIFAKQTNSIVEVKYLDSLTQEPSNWLEILLKNHYADPVHFTFEQFFHQTDNSVGCGAFAIESALLGLNLDINKLNEKNIRHLHQELLNKYQNVPSIIATETTPSAKKPSITFVDLSLILPLSININSSRTMRGGRKTKKTPANNEPPVVSDLLKVKIRNTVIEFTTKDFTDKFSDPEGDSLIKIQTTSLPDHGSLKLGATDVETNQEIVSGDLEDLIFDPEENWNGNTSFGWKGHDGYTYSTDAANVNISMIVTLRPVVVGSEPTSGSAIGVAVAGDYAYVADYDEGLQVINIADSTNPQIVGHKDTDGYAFGVAVAGDYAYVADYDKGLQVINIADSTNPQIVGHKDTDGYARGMTVAGDYAYVADGPAGLQVINIADSTSPQIVGHTYTDDKAYGVAVAGDYAYVADYDKGLQVINIVDSTNPQIVGHKDMDGTAYGVAVAGDYAYVANDYAGLQVINIADSTNPQIVGHKDTNGSAKGVAVAGDYAYVADDYRGLQVIKNEPNKNPAVSDVAKAAATDTTIVFKTKDFIAKFTDPDDDSLAKIKVLSLPKHGTLKLSDNDVVVNQQIISEDLEHLTFTPEEYWIGDTSFEWNGCDGDLYATTAAKVNIKIVNTLAPVLISSLITGDEAYGITLAGDYAYVADGKSGLKIVNVAAPSAPKLIGNLDTDGYAYDVVVMEDYAYVADGWSGLKIINITSPSAPELVDSLDTDGSAVGIAIVGNYAYLADESKGLKVINITTPAAPTLVGSRNTDGYAWGVAVAGDYAYVADGSAGLQIIHIVDPADPEIVGHVDTDGNAAGVAIEGGYAYIADGSNGLQLSDITDPTAPTLGNRINTDGNAYRVTIEENYAYIADGEGGLKIIDIVIPSSLVLVGSLTTAGPAYGVAVAGDYTYVADGEHGLKIIKNNNIPVVDDMSKTEKENTTMTFSAENFTAKFNDADNDHLTKVQITSLPSNGELQLFGDKIEIDQEIVTEDLNNLTFVPVSDWLGKTSFSWKGYDGYVYSTNAAMVNISIIALLSPILVGSVHTDGNAYGVAVAGDYAYVADYDKGLQVINIANSTNPQIVGHKDTDGYAEGVAVAGDYAYVADYDKGLQVINIANSTNPQIVGHTDTVGHAEGVAVAGDYAYVADGSKGLQVINIANSTNPQIVGHKDTDGFAYGVAVAGDYAYVADGSKGLIKINIVIPSSPELVGSVDTGGSARGVAVQGYYSYVAAGNGGLKIMRNEDMPPEIQDIAKSATTNETITFNKTDFTSKYSDPDEDPLNKVKIPTLPNNGTLALFSNAVLADQEIQTAHLDNLIFEPNSTWHGRTYFTWQGYDGFVYSSKAANVTMLIDTPPNFKKEIEKLGNPKQEVKFKKEDFTDVFTDVDNDELEKIEITSMPEKENGILRLSGNTVQINQEIDADELDHLTFEPETQWHGETYFEWKAYDGFEYSVNSTKVNMIIDTPPDIVDFEKLGVSDQDLMFAAQDFDNAYQDVDGDQLAQIKITTLPNTGTLKLLSSPVAANSTIIHNDLVNLVFQLPVSGWQDSTEFNWLGYDGYRYSANSAKVTISISNAKPTIDDLIILGTVDQLLEFEASDFKHGFHDENSNHKLEKIKILSLPDAGGELAFAGKAVEKNQEIKTKDLEDLTFSPQFGWSGKTTFTWAGTDGLNYSDEAKVTIDIPSKNFCSTYWWLCYLIPACLTAAGITASVGMFALKYYLKIRRLKAEAMGDIELANITPLDNPLAGESIL